MAVRSPYYVRGRFTPEQQLMARSKRGAKSEAIRTYLAANPDAGPTAVVAALKEQGVKVTVGLAANIKHRLSKPKSQRARRSTGKRGSTNGSAEISLDQLLAAKQMVDSLGGVEAARAALDALVALQQEI